MEVVREKHVPNSKSGVIYFPQRMKPFAGYCVNTTTKEKLKKPGNRVNFHPIHLVRVKKVQTYLPQSQMIKNITAKRVNVSINLGKVGKHAVSISEQGIHS